MVYISLTLSGAGGFSGTVLGGYKVPLDSVVAAFFAVEGEGIDIGGIF